MTGVERTKGGVEGKKKVNSGGVLQSHVGECTDVDWRQRNIRPW